MNVIVDILRKHLPKYRITSALLADLQKVHSGPNESVSSSRTRGSLAASPGQSEVEATALNSPPFSGRADAPLSQTLREETKMNDEDLCKAAERFIGAGAATIAHELRLIRDHAYSVGYRHGYADAATDLGA